MYYNRLYLIIIASYISAGKYKVVSYNQISTAQFLKIEMARCLYGMQQILKHICIEWADEVIPTSASLKGL